ncbi:hypothetical protein PI23P_04587 [Polaribacter irgensii 23-P]|uniref:Uncharacterized protein n=1 Tax=Polaribacter irgensii 23-P TaxID=313594 RepID=A4BXQ4_9FLAO|nr:hypothetical protein [Polaribacter irgensii]EAR13745.1 hypothetical protein PI23P_04587 [Polaribacter irgensii 23-P]
MAQIWFGDLDMSIDSKSEINISELKIALNTLYKIYEEKDAVFFKDFRPVIISEEKNEISFDKPFFKDWQINKYLIPFVIQGGNFKERNIGWGWKTEEHFDNKLVQEFTNDLMKLIGEGSKMNFSFDVNADNVYEEYQIDISTNFKSKIPKTKFHAYFHSEEDDKDEDEDEGW